MYICICILTLICICIYLYVYMYMIVWKHSGVLLLFSLNYVVLSISDQLFFLKYFRFFGFLDVNMRNLHYNFRFFIFFI